MALVAAFTKATGVEVKVINESLDDVQPKASVAANTNQGPDMFWGLYSLPHLFPAKCVDVTDVADFLGKKYGGWVPTAETYGKSGGKWIAIPVAYNGNVINYRQSMIEKAGFKEIPKDTAGFLELMKALKEKSVPGGFALGRASGDGNAWVHWALWSHGGNLVDKDDKVIINSPETVKALEYIKALSDTFVSGTASWNDAFNNKAFLESQISLTNNGVSIYASAKAAAAKDDAKAKEVMDDMNHSLWPVGPVGQPDRVPHRLPADDHDLLEGTQRLQGVHGLHAGRAAVQPVADRLGGLPDAPAQRLRRQPGVEVRSEAVDAARCGQAHAHRGRARLGGREGSRGAGRLHHARHGGLGVHRPCIGQGRHRGGRAPGQAHLSLRLDPIG